MKMFNLIIGIFCILVGFVKPIDFMSRYCFVVGFLIIFISNSNL
jgi:hypothetical protein